MLAKKKRVFEILGFVVIFLIALFFRLHNLEKTLLLDDDRGRDFLVAKHYFADQGSAPLVSPYANGSENILRNSAFYFLYRAVIYNLGGNSVVAATQVVMLIDAVAVFAVIGIGYQLNNQKLGFLLGLIVAIHPVLISNAQSNFHPYFVQPFLFFALFWLLRAIAKKSSQSLFFAWCFLFLTLHIHLAPIVLFVPFTISSYFFIAQNRKKLHRSFYLTLFLLLSFLVVLFLYLTRFQIINLTSFFQSLFHRTAAEAHTASLFSKITSLGSQISNITQYDAETQTTSNVPLLLISFMTIGNLLFLFDFFKKKVFSAETCLHILFIFWPLVLPMRLFFSWYFTIYALIGIVFGIYLLNQLIYFLVPKKSKKYAVPFTACLLLIWFLPRIIHFDAAPIFGNSSKFEEIAEQMLQAAHSSDPTTLSPQLSEQFVIIDKWTEDTLWSSSGIWYFLEKKTGTNLVRICSDPQSICPRLKNPKYFFFICPANKLDCVHDIFDGYDEAGIFYYKQLLHIPSDFFLPEKFKHIEKLNLSESTSEFVQVWLVYE